MAGKYFFVLSCWYFGDVPESRRIYLSRVELATSWYPVGDRNVKTMRGAEMSELDGSVSVLALPFPFVSESDFRTDR